MQKIKLFLIHFLISGLILLLFIYLFDKFSLFLVSLNSDLNFVELIKNMSIKNHNDPSLFVKNYKEAITEEQKIKIILTNNFYECIYNNINNIKTKSDINIYCGHYIKF